MSREEYYKYLNGPWQIKGSPVLVDVPLFVYPYTYWNTYWLLKNLGNCEWGHYKHSYGGVAVNICFQFFWVNTKKQERWMPSYSKVTVPFCILMSNECSCCSISLPTLGLVNVLDLVILIDVWWYFMVALICNSETKYDAEHTWVSRYLLAICVSLLSRLFFCF